MVPENEEDIYQILAEEFGMSIQQCEEMADFLWSLIRRCMDDDTLPLVWVEGFGTFNVKPGRLKFLLMRSTLSEETRSQLSEVYERRLIEKFHYRKSNRIPGHLFKDVHRMYMEGKLDLSQKQIDKSYTTKKYIDELRQGKADYGSQRSEKSGDSETGEGKGEEASQGDV